LQDQNRAVLYNKIREASENLEALKKTSFGSNIVEQNSVFAPPTKKKENVPVNFNDIL
jgi:hypothetical protein